MILLIPFLRVGARIMGGAHFVLDPVVLLKSFPSVPQSHARGFDGIVAHDRGLGGDGTYGLRVRGTHRAGSTWAERATKRTTKERPC
jgi:hypothetical protein